jgi:hypothetical protein
VIVTISPVEGPVSSRSKEADPVAPLDQGMCVVPALVETHDLQARACRNFDERLVFRHQPKAARLAGDHDRIDG